MTRGMSLAKVVNDFAAKNDKKAPNFSNKKFVQAVPLVIFYNVCNRL